MKLIMKKDYSYTYKAVISCAIWCLLMFFVVALYMSVGYEQVGEVDINLLNIPFICVLYIGSILGLLLIVYSYVCIKKTDSILWHKIILHMLESNVLFVAIATFMLLYELRIKYSFV